MKTDIIWWSIVAVAILLLLPAVVGTFKLFLFGLFGITFQVTPAQVLATLICAGIGFKILGELH